MVGRRCIELGAGSTVVSIVAASQGAAQSVATDGNQDMVSLAKANAQNALTPAQLNAFYSAVYTWGGEVPLHVPGGSFTFDTVLLTDVLYARMRVPALLRGVDAVCRARCRVLVAYERRFDGVVLFDASSASNTLDQNTRPTVRDLLARLESSISDGNTETRRFEDETLLGPVASPFLHGLEMMGFAVKHLPYEELAPLREGVVVDSEAPSGGSLPDTIVAVASRGLAVHGD